MTQRLRNTDLTPLVTMVAIGVVAWTMTMLLTLTVLDENQGLTRLIMILSGAIFVGIPGVLFVATLLIKLRDGTRPRA